MKEELTTNEWNHLHDVVYDATWETTKTKLTQAELESLYDELPNHLKAEISHWGLNDTVVRDSIYEWYVNNKLKL